MGDSGESRQAGNPRGRGAVWGMLLAAAALLWWLFAEFAQTDRTLAMRERQMAVFFASFAVFLGAVCTIWWAGPVISRRLVWCIVIAGALFRLLVMPSRSVASSDIYRYVWEGRVVRAGMNPYSHPPRSAELEPLRDWVWPLVQHKSVSAAYPPAAQYVFALADGLLGNPVTDVKRVLAFFDLGTLVLLPGLLAGLGVAPGWVIIYAWHPLVVCEVVARGHLDAVGIFFMVVALRLLVGRTRATSALAGAALATSILAKGYALCIAPFLVRAAGPHRRAFVLAMLAAGAAAYAPFLSAGGDLFSGLIAYSTRWVGNAIPFAVVDATLARVTAHHGPISRAVLGAALAVWMGVLLRRRREDVLLAEVDLSFLTLAGLFVLSPVVYPWYLAHTIPFLCLRPRVPWLLLTGTAFAFYAHDFAGHHQEIWWVTALEYGVPLALAAILHLRGGARGMAPGRGREPVRAAHGSG